MRTIVASIYRAPFKTFSSRRRSTYFFQHENGSTTLIPVQSIRVEIVFVYVKVEGGQGYIAEVLKYLHNLSREKSSDET